jgi:NAD(P)-dependent dehydrogenase (short-subunit alcohol dehydrogenase family)
MNIEGTTALVTGANRGIGQELARVLVAQGATVYGGARDPGSITDAGVIPIQLDVTDADSIAAAAARLTDVDLVINNAGVGTGAPLLSEGAADAARHELEVNYFGTMAVSRAFAPILAANGGGTLVNILSVVSWVAVPAIATYSASKAAAWSLTNALRTVLRADGTRVVGVHFGYVDTDLTAGFDIPKLDRVDVVGAVIAGLVADQEEIIVDPFTQSIKDGLSDDTNLIWPEIQRQHDEAKATA